MSLFVTSLAFPSAEVSAVAKMGNFAGSLVAGGVGWVLLGGLNPPAASRGRP